SSTSAPACSPARPESPDPASTGRRSCWPRLSGPSAARREAALRAVDDLALDRGTVVLRRWWGTPAHPYPPGAEQVPGQGWVDPALGQPAYPRTGCPPGHR